MQSQDWIEDRKVYNLTSYKALMLLVFLKHLSLFVFGFTIDRLFQ